MRGGIASLFIGTLIATTAGAQSPANSVPTGAIAGVVTDAGGRPLAGATVSVASLAVQTTTDSTGQFALAGLPSRNLTFSVRLAGYRPANATLSLPAGRTLNVSITMVQIVASLDTVVVKSVVQNQVGGIVTDRDGKPLAGVEVEVLGQRMETETAPNGRFLLLDLDPGAYVLQFRAPGYRITQYSVRMIAQIDRDLAVRLAPFDVGDRFTPEMAKQVAREANQRRAWRTRGATSVGRDEFERWGEAPLAVALAASSAAPVARLVDPNCLLLNGYEILTPYAGRTQLRSVAGRGVPTSVNADVAAANSPTRELPVGSNQTSWLNHFRANEVELVEVFPAGADYSGTISARFTPSSGCGESALIIWLR